MELKIQSSGTHEDQTKWKPSLWTKIKWFYESDYFPHFVSLVVSIVSLIISIIALLLN